MTKDTTRSTSMIPPIKVTLAVSEQQVKNNISENLKIIPTWFDQFFYPNGFEAFIISGGPSMEKYVEELNLVERCKHPNRGFITICVKHALPRLLKMGIEPDFCILLDGRPLNEDSTHGVNRKSLFEEVPSKTIFLVASMSHPDYANYLMTHGARVMGWHTQVTGLKEFNINGPIINGGTSSGTRAISVCHALGIREMTLIGFDSCHHGLTDEQKNEVKEGGKSKYIPHDMSVAGYKFNDEQFGHLRNLGESIDKDGYGFRGEVIKRFWTTGELLAQAQDFEAIFSNPEYDLQFKVFDDGLVSHIFNNIQRPIRGRSFIEYFRNAVPKKTYDNVPRRKIIPKETKK